MSAVQMSKVWEMRRLISKGYKVKDVASWLKVPESTVRQYTKMEREKAKNNQQVYV